MRFAFPEAFFLLALVPGILVLLHLVESRRTLRMALAGDRELVRAMAHNPRGRIVRLVQAILLATSMGFVALALARPQFGSHTELRKARGMDVVVALDLSRSMLARDVVPSRLERAKIEIGDLLRTLRGDRVGLVGFTSGALPLSPLTVDHAAVALQLKAAHPRDMPRGGTAIGQAIKTAQELLERGKGRAADQAVIIVTDGEEHEGDPEAAAKKAREAGIEVHVVGVGSRTGEPIPEVDDAGRVTGYIKDAQGRTVVSRLGESYLSAIAEAGEGLVALPGPAGGLDLSEVRSHLLTRKRAELEDRVVRIYQERFQWPLGIAFLLLLSATLIRPSRRGGVRKQAGAGPERPSPTGPSAAGSAAAVLLPLFLAPSIAAANPASSALSTEDPDARAGRAALGEGRGDDARASFEAARERLGDRPELLYDLGLSAIARGELGEAEPLLQRAISQSQDRTLRAESAFALGNAYRKQRKYDEAIELYQRALLEDPRVTGARRNLEITRRMKAIRAAQPPSEDGEPEEQPPNPDGGPPDGGDGGADGGTGGPDGGSDSADAGSSSAGTDGGNTPDAGSGDPDPSDGGQGSPDAGGAEEDQPGQEADGGTPPSASPAQPDAPSGDSQDAEQLLEALEEQERALQRKRQLRRFGDKKVKKDW